MGAMGERKGCHYDRQKRGVLGQPNKILSRLSIFRCRVWDSHPVKRLPLAAFSSPLLHFRTTMGILTWIACNGNREKDPHKSVSNESATLRVSATCVYGPHKFFVPVRREHVPTSFKGGRRSCSRMKKSIPSMAAPLVPPSQQRNSHARHEKKTQTCLRSKNTVHIF